jgi:hypothetical protein
MAHVDDHFHLTQAAVEIATHSFNELEAIAVYSTDTIRSIQTDIKDVFILLHRIFNTNEVMGINSQLMADNFYPMMARLNQIIQQNNMLTNQKYMYRQDQP